MNDIEERVAEYAARVYGGDMPVAVKASYRAMLRREDKEEDRWGLVSTSDGFDDYWLMKN